MFRGLLPGSTCGLLSGGEAEQVGGIDGGRLIAAIGVMPCWTIAIEFVGVAAFRVHRNAGVGAEGDADAGGEGAPHILAGGPIRHSTARTSPV